MSESSAVVEKSLRSVFVGNIPYEATEEKLKEIFSQVGPVVSFKLMHDRETGKPKGYGFCEYKDQETALSAMRNLNAFEIGGRPLRVDNACTEKSRMEMQSLMMGTVVESPYGSEVEPSQAPEAISNAVASLPPEQMFELMRQMQVCVRSNRAEARTMLLNNPQLAYALLQAQVVMRIIDPKTALQLLHGDQALPGTAAGPVIKTEPNTNGTMKNQPIPPSSVSSSNGPGQQNPRHFGPPPQGPPPQGPPQQMGGPPRHPGSMHHQGLPPPHHQPPHGIQGPPGGPPPQRFPSGGDFDLRGAPPPNRGADQDMRMPPRDYPPPHHDFDSRYGRDGRSGDFDQRYRDQQQFPARDNSQSSDSAVRAREGMDRDYRGAPHDSRGRSQHTDEFSRGGVAATSGAPTAGLPPNLASGLAGHDQEKASLIMQVLQLTDEQIRMLPPEQQASIMQLKEQIQQSQH